MSFSRIWDLWDYWEYNHFMYVSITNWAVFNDLVNFSLINVCIFIYKKINWKMSFVLFSYQPNHRSFSECTNSFIFSLFVTLHFHSRSWYSPHPYLAVFFLVPMATLLHLFWFFEQQGSCNCNHCIFPWLQPVALFITSFSPVMFSPSISHACIPFWHDFVFTGGNFT